MIALDTLFSTDALPPLSITLMGHGCFLIIYFITQLRGFVTLTKYAYWVAKVYGECTIMSYEIFRM
jgi:hypothetical protein